MVSFAEGARLIYLLVPAFLLVGAVIRHRRRLRQQRDLASPAVWQRLMGGTPSTGLWRMLLWCGAMALMILALARPQWGEKQREVSVQTRDLVFALDLSKSMQCPDVQPDRLQRALSVIRHSLPGLDGNRVGVVIFAGGAYPLVPLTTDLEAVASFLDGVEPEMVSEPGSNLQAAADAAVKLLPPEGEGRVLVLFSDGENLQGDLEAARKSLKEAGVSFIGVMVGTKEGGPIPERDANGAVHYKRDRDGGTVVTHADPSTLKEMAKALNGALIDANRGETEKQLVAAVAQLRTRELETKRKPEKIERFPVFLGAAAFLLIFSFLLSPWRRGVLAACLGLLLLTPTLEAQQQGPPVGGMSMPGVQQPAGHPPSQAQLPPGAAGQCPKKEPPPPEPKVSWWQRLIPGGVRRLARSGLSSWKKGDREKAAEKFGAATILDPENPQRLYDYGTALAAGGHPQAAVPLLEKAGKLPGAEYNAGTAALQAKKADVALRHLRKALLENPQDPDAKRNYELALRLLEQQKEQQKQQKDDKNQKKDQKDKKKEEKQKQEEQKKKEQQQKQQGVPTPTPAPGAKAQPQPSPTPDPKAGLYSALQQSESDARKAMRTPVPAKGHVEKDW